MPPGTLAPSGPDRVWGGFVSGAAPVTPVITPQECDSATRPQTWPCSWHQRTLRARRPLAPPSQPWPGGGQTPVLAQMASAWGCRAVGAPSTSHPWGLASSGRLLDSVWPWPCRGVPDLGESQDAQAGLARVGALRGGGWLRAAAPNLPQGPLCCSRRPGLGLSEPPWAMGSRNQGTGLGGDPGQEPASGASWSWQWG